MHSITLFTMFLLINFASCIYEPNWKSLDTRPLPQWYDDAKFGIFIHWGVFSVPSYVSEWFWYYWATGNVQIKKFMADNYPPDFTYADFAAQFDAQLFNPDQWADIFNASGAQYIVLTSKHHEGFTNWPSKYSWNWNSMDVGPKRDLVGDLAASIRNRTKIRFGLYHSLFEWFNPNYNEDAKNNFKTQRFVQTKTMPELYELVMTYKPEVVWSDGDAGPDTYWNSTQFIAWLYNESPVKDTVVVNDRWGNGVSCNHGDFYTCADRYIPGSALGHKWENCMTIDRYSWGYRREATYNDYIRIENLIAILVETVSKGGNLLMNIGPTKAGTIMPLFEERLKQMGHWLDMNGEGIYSTRAWKFQNDSITQNVWYTKSNVDPSGSTIYAIFLAWPTSNLLSLGRPKVDQSTEISMLGYHGDVLKWSYTDKSVDIQLPYDLSKDSRWGWVLKFKGVMNGW